MHTLQLLEGPGAPRTFALGPGVTTLGRAEGNDVLLDGAKVSKRHLILSVQEDDQVYLEDLSSRNGVFVDDRRVTEQVLRPGSHLRVGENLLRYDRASASEGRASLEESLPGTLEESLPGKKVELPPGYRLWITDGRGYFDIVNLAEECVYLGKAASNEVVLSGADVSRRHAVLWFQKGRWEVQDLESTNGTFLNGQPVEQAVLGAGDRLRIGSGFLLALEGPRSAVIQDEFEAQARQELKRLGSYMPRSTQVLLLIGFLVICVTLVILVLLKLWGTIG